MRNRRVLYGVMFSFVACGISFDDYVEYVTNPDNGLVVTQSNIQGYYRMSYRPIDLFAKSEQLRSKEPISSLKESFGNLEYYILEISNQSPSQNDKVDFYYAYSLERDIYQIRNQDTIRPSLYQLELGLRGSTSLRVNLAFTPNDGDRNIIVDDKYGQTCNFQFKEQDIANIPKMNL